MGSLLSYSTTAENEAYRVIDAAKAKVTTGAHNER
jgi:hypothetical protein